MLTVAEVARRLGLREGTVRLWISRGKLAHVRLGRRAVRIPVEEVERLIRENTIPSRDDRRAAGGAGARTKRPVVNLPADLQETALLHARIRARFKKLFMQHGENEADAAAMADVATRDR